jgi:hypothetical protein
MPPTPLSWSVTLGAHTLPGRVRVHGGVMRERWLTPEGFTAHLGPDRADVRILLRLETAEEFARYEAIAAELTAVGPEAWWPVAKSVALPGISLLRVIEASAPAQLDAGGFEAFITCTDRPTHPRSDA